MAKRERRVGERRQRSVREPQVTAADRGRLVGRIEEILTTEIPGTPKVDLRKAARHLAKLATTDIPGTHRVDVLARQIADVLKSDIPGTEGYGVREAASAFSKVGRVEYVRLRGSVKDLSRRAQQVVAALDKHRGHGTSADLQKWMRVNRNVIAGALHELRQAKLIKSNRVGS